MRPTHAVTTTHQSWKNISGTWKGEKIKSDKSSNEFQGIEILSFLGQAQWVLRRFANEYPRIANCFNIGLPQGNGEGRKNIKAIRKKEGKSLTSFWQVIRYCDNKLSIVNFDPKSETTICFLDWSKACRIGRIYSTRQQDRSRACNDAESRYPSSKWEVLHEKRRIKFTSSFFCKEIRKDFWRYLLSVKSYLMAVDNRPVVWTIT